MRSYRRLTRNVMKPHHWQQTKPRPHASTNLDTSTALARMFMLHNHVGDNEVVHNYVEAQCSRAWLGLEGWGNLKHRNQLTTYKANRFRYPVLILSSWDAPRSTYVCVCVRVSDAVYLHSRGKWIKAYFKNENKSKRPWYLFKCCCMLHQVADQISPPCSMYPPTNEPQLSVAYCVH